MEANIPIEIYVMRAIGWISALFTRTILWILRMLISGLAIWIVMRFLRWCWETPILD